LARNIVIRQNSNSDFGNRIFRAARLDVALYEEVEADKSALGRAINE
jgi:hypothetical protein